MARRPLRVLVIPAWFPTSRRPMHGLFVRDQVRAAAELNDLVVVADDGARSESESRVALRDAREDGIRTLRIAHPRPASELTTARYVAGVFASLAKLRREGWHPDLIHAHVYYTGLVAALAKMRYKVPVLVSEHSSHFLLGTMARGDRVRARVAFGLADLVCPVSTALARSIAALRIRTPLVVVPNAVDTAAFTPSPSPRQLPKRALVVAGLHPVKDVPNLLAAAALLQHRGRDWCIDIVGDGPERSRCENIVRAAGLGQQVTFHGYQPRVVIADFLRRSHFLVLPSRAETFGVAVVEALAAGRPVVATDVGIVRDVVDESMGIVVRPGDPSSLAAGIDEMLDTHCRFEPAALAARAAALFSYHAVGRQWDEVYRQVADRTRGPKTSRLRRTL